MPQCDFWKSKKNRLFAACVLLPVSFIKEPEICKVPGFNPKHGKKKASEYFQMPNKWGILGTGPKSKHRDHVSFIFTLYIQPEANFIQYFS